ncbi:uncharacterized protein LOC129352945 [Poeciliopsis prolifica]|uniref:uncharacterized protein LOC129352945 n=1 Tax=Poeciliopsis prolifica TaxID=188132 RepID=UPI0024140FE9|nr:uncharacterized protein LOC129352945 [Poeciliopsis prolifica]
MEERSVKLSDGLGEEVLLYLTGSGNHHSFSMTGDTLLCVFLSLQISSSPAAGDQMNGSAGGDFSGFCGSSFSGTRKIFCRENCGEGNVLVETKEDSAANGRYSIEYVRGQVPNIYSLLVKISGLTGSDSGRYRCGLGKSYQDFTLSVSGVSTSRPSTSWSSSSESFTPSVSSGITSQSVPTQENPTTSDCSPSQTAADVQLFVLPVLAVTAALLAAMMMKVFCRRSKKPQTDSAVEMHQSPAACETTRIDDDDDVREEDGRWRSADVEIYVAYIDAISSSVTAAAQQRQAPDDQEDEAEVNFSSRLLDSALRAAGGCSRVTVLRDSPSTTTSLKSWNEADDDDEESVKPHRYRPASDRVSSEMLTYNRVSLQKNFKAPDEKETHEIKTSSPGCRK